MFLNEKNITHLFSSSFSLSLAATSSCDKQGTWLQVLGSGGPEVNDGRASSGYLIWHSGYARVLVDLGSGSLSRFEQSKALINDMSF